MSEYNACFSPYMLISSTLQTVFGYEKRSEQETQLDISLQHQLELRRAQEEFQDELEIQKIADLRAKMAVARRYRAEERFDQTVLQHRTEELRTYFSKCLPISQDSIPVLLSAAIEYKSHGYNEECPLNVVLLRTKQAALDYVEIFDTLEKSQIELGNIKYRRWCNKDIARNSAILNLHAIMSNIPTLVISPYFQGNMFHFTVSMWEAQSETKPLIRPLFSLPCPQTYLASKEQFTVEGKDAIQKQIVLVSTIISGCARDTYMLMTQGRIPTLPIYISNHPEVQNALMQPENHELCSFMLNEYRIMHSLLKKQECTSKLLSKEAMEHLATIAEHASENLLSLTNNMIKA